MHQIKDKETVENTYSLVCCWLVAIICAAALILIAVLGPAMLDIIHYRTSQSGIWQTQVFDVTDLIVLVPLLLIGGTFQLLKNKASKFFLILTL